MKFDPVASAPFVDASLRQEFFVLIDLVADNDRGFEDLWPQKLSDMSTKSLSSRHTGKDVLVGCRCAGQTKTRYARPR